MPDGCGVVRTRAICSTFNVAERRFRLRAGIGVAEKSFSRKEGVDECSERTIFVSPVFQEMVTLWWNLTPHNLGRILRFLSEDMGEEHIWSQSVAIFLIMVLAKQANE